jgi:DNA-directed RNA polymerase specialized sigma24 family protein
MSEPAASPGVAFFDRFLAWLDFHRTRATATHEEFRQRLLQHFRRRGHASSAEDLASEVLHRALAKCAEGYPDGIDPAPYLYGIARNVVHELRRQGQGRSELEGSDPADPAPPADSVLIGNDLLRHCLAVLTGEERALLQRYYRDDSSAARQMLAKENGLSREHLSVRIFAIKRKILERLKHRN